MWEVAGRESQTEECCTKWIFLANYERYYGVSVSTIGSTTSVYNIILSKLPNLLRASFPSKKIGTIIIGFSSLDCNN